MIDALFDVLEYACQVNGIQLGDTGAGPRSHLRLVPGTDESAQAS
jgi:hypothetical protein